MTTKAAKAKLHSIIQKQVAQHVAEQATGEHQNAPDGGKFYVRENGEGRPVSDMEARRRFRAGEEVEAPNAGAGSYNEVLARLGFNCVELFDCTSSAGDWSIEVRTGTVFQRNRYPSCGFGYTLLRNASFRSGM